MSKQRNVAFWRKLYFDLANEVEQVLGKALEYPKYSDDQKNFPGTTEADGVCLGEHVPESILAEAARVVIAQDLKTERLNWLLNEPDKPHNNLSTWQKIVVREALGLKN